MSFVLRILLIGGVLLLEACSKPSVTGGYMFTDPTTIEYITLVQSADGHLEGTFTFAATSWVDHPGFAQEDGRLNGSTDGKSLTLTLTSPRWSEPTPITGRADGGSLVIVTRDSAPIRLLATTPEKYAATRRALMAAQRLTRTAQ